MLPAGMLVDAHIVVLNEWIALSAAGISRSNSFLGSSG